MYVLCCHHVHAIDIMPDDTGSIMNIMRMNTGMFCDMAH